ncbi:MAG: hypothetical protein ABIG64_03275 [Candidatus Omnitrophota bacterium]
MFEKTTAKTVRFLSTYAVIITYLFWCISPVSAARFQAEPSPANHATLSPTLQIMDTIKNIISNPKVPQYVHYLPEAENPARTITLEANGRTRNVAIYGIESAEGVLALWQMFLYGDENFNPVAVIDTTNTPRKIFETTGETLDLTTEYLQQRAEAIANSIRHSELYGDFPGIVTVEVDNSRLYKPVYINITYGQKTAKIEVVIADSIQENDFLRGNRIQYSANQRINYILHVSKVRQAERFMREYLANSISRVITPLHLPKYESNVYVPGVSSTLDKQDKITRVGTGTIAAVSFLEKMISASGLKLLEGSYDVVHSNRPDQPTTHNTISVTRSRSGQFFPQVVNGEHEVMNAPSYNFPHPTGTVILYTALLQGEHDKNEIISALNKGIAQGNLKNKIEIWAGNIATSPDMVKQMENGVIVSDYIKIKTSDIGTLVIIPFMYDDKWTQTTQLLEMARQIRYQDDHPDQGMDQPDTMNFALNFQSDQLHQKQTPQHESKEPIKSTPIIKEKEIPSQLLDWNNLSIPATDSDTPIPLTIIGGGRTSQSAIWRLLGDKRFDVKAIIYADKKIGRLEAFARLLNEAQLGRFPLKITFDQEHETWIEFTNTQTGETKRISFYKRAEKTRESILSIPFKEIGTTMLYDSSGQYLTEETSGYFTEHPEVAGFIMAAPSENAKTKILHFVSGTSEWLGEWKQLFKDKIKKIISPASCTTTCITPVLFIMQKMFGVKNYLFATLHAATGELIIPKPNKKNKPGRERTGTNLAFTSTGAAGAAGLVNPELQGKGDGFAIRGPALSGSYVTLNMITVEPVKNAEYLNKIFTQLAQTGLKNRFAVIEGITSTTQFIRSKAGSILMPEYTRVKPIFDESGQVIASFVSLRLAYPNEGGFSESVLQMSKELGQYVLLQQPIEFINSAI